MELFIGVVENNDDPDKVGKVQIRIPSVHGIEGSDIVIPTEGLPWYEPSIPFFAGYNYGSVVIPPVGAMVWCIEQEVESGNPYRVYFGGMYGTGVKNEKKFNGTDVPKEKLETPEEALEGYPDTAVLFKSLSGTYVLINNTGDFIIKDNTTNATIKVGQGSVMVNAVNIQLKGRTTITGDTNIYGNVTIKGGEHNITGDTNITGNTTVTGDFTTSGGTVNLN